MNAKRFSIDLATFLGAVGLFAKFQTSVCAQEASSAAEARTTVHVGLYVNQIENVSLRDNQFKIDFVIWFRWRGDELEPHETFEVVGGQIESAHVDETTDLGDMHYAAVRVVATITQFWNVSRFPLDDHTLRIAIEDSQDEEFKLRYIADTENCGANPALQAPGWAVGTHHCQVLSQAYRTNYGDTSLPTGHESTYSRFFYTIPLVRPNWGFFLKLFFGLFVATGISFLSFFIRPTDLDPRFGLGVGAIFASVASEYVVTSSLPDTTVLTMADVLHILAFVFIFLTLVESTFSLRIYTRGGDGPRRSERLDWWSFVTLAAGYVGSSLMVVLWY